MKYKEYIVTSPTQNTSRRLGIFGEKHLYSQEETNYARTVVPTYNTVALEGDQKKSLFWDIVSLIYRPITLAYLSGTKRSPSNQRVRDIAKEQDQRIIYFNDTDSKHFSFWQKITLVGLGLLTVPLAPLVSWYTKKHGGDLFKKEGKKKSLISRWMDYAINSSKREKIMADRTAELLSEQNSGDVLANCGEDHLDGIVNNLKNNGLTLEEKVSYP